MSEQATATPKLEWTETDDGWEAPSVLHDEGVPFAWRVQPDGVGLEWWAVDRSDSELLSAWSQIVPLTLAGAKAWCQGREDELRDSCDASPKDYDAGLLAKGGGGDVGWWQDYIRVLLRQANGHWRAEYEALQEHTEPIERQRDDLLAACKKAAEGLGRVTVTVRNPADPDQRRMSCAYAILSTAIAAAEPTPAAQEPKP